MILPTEPAVSSCLPLVVAVLFSQSPILASPAGWSRLAANAQTCKHKQISKSVSDKAETAETLQHTVLEATVLTGKDFSAFTLLYYFTKYYDRL